MKLGAVSQTDVGKVRDHNEDAVGEPSAFAAREARGYVFAVADGLGGHDGGEIASRIAIDTTLTDYYASDEAPDVALVNAVLHANEKIAAASDASIDTSENRPAAAARRMGSTIVAAVVHDSDVFGVNVGDSRAYLLHDRHLTRLTHDQSLVGEHVRSGRMTEAEAKHHQYRNILLQCLGHGAAVAPERYAARLEPGDVLLLCSDGLHGVVDDSEIERVVNELPPAAAADALIAAANAAGGPDNISVVLVWCNDDEVSA